MKISVIIVAYKNSKVVIDLLNSIQKYNDIGDELEVIIVDNSPEDCRIDDAIKIAEYKGYKYITADNRGFGAGNNIGAAVAQGEILAFLNPDIILVEHIFKKICNKFQQNSKLAMVGGQLLTEDYKDNGSFSWRFEHSGSLFNNVLAMLCNKFKIFIPSRMNITGADLIIRKYVFDEVGRFDENIFMYCEEPDLTLRIQAKFPEMKIKFCPDIRLIHLERRSSFDEGEKYYTEFFRSLKYYCQKHKFNFEKICKQRLRVASLKMCIDSVFRPKQVKLRQQRCDFIKKMLNSNM